MFSACDQSGCHLEENMPHEIFSRGKLQHFFSPCVTQRAFTWSIREEDNSVTLDYIGIHKGETRATATYSLYMMTSLWQLKSCLQYIMYWDIEAHVNVQAMCCNTITTTAEALNWAIILLQCTAGPVALDLKALKDSWAPTRVCVLEQCQAASLCNLQLRQCTESMTTWSPDLRVNTSG